MGSSSRRSRSRSRSRDRDRDRKDRDRDRDRDREKEKSKDSKEKKRDEKDKDKDRDREKRRRSRSRSRSRDRKKHRSDDKSKDKSKEKSKDKDKDKEKSKDKDKSKDRKPSADASSSSAPAEEPAPVAVPAAVAVAVALTEEEEEAIRKRKERLEAWRRARGQATDSATPDPGGPKAEVLPPKTETEPAVALAPIKAEAGAEPATNGKSSSSSLHGHAAVVKDEPMDVDVKEEEASSDEGEFIGADKGKRGLQPNYRLLNDELEESDDEDAAPAAAQAQAAADDDEDDDPLDAFMAGVEKEVRSLHAADKRREKAALPVREKKKAERVYNDEDHAEYSSEEEEKDDGFVMPQASKAKEIKSVDFNAIDKIEFRKDFYVEVPEIREMTDDEVFNLRVALDNIRVKGKNAPKPIKNWAQAGLSQKIFALLKKLGYEKPMPIQAQTVPAIMSGRDVIGIAKTGSGKTLAFLLPMYRHVLDQPPLEPGEGPIAVIMAPTRELTVQIYNEARKFSKVSGLRCACVYGGTGISEQIAELKRGTEIIVCTPGRMIDMLCANSGRVTNLIRVTYLVLDEADRMFDMGFEPQVTKIVENTRPDRQTVLFSATFPRQMEALARKILTNPIEVNVGGRSIVSADIEQHVVVIEEDDKFLKLLELLGLYVTTGQVLVFVERQESCDTLFKDLIRAGYSCVTLHGGMDQEDRDSTLEDFKGHNVPLMIATSVAARGLDVKGLTLVVNYDVPNHYEDYVHRCGRTGRAGNKGTAYTFITPEQERYSGEIVKALELSFAPVPDELRQLWTAFKEKKAAGLVKDAGSGFGGHGFKFDAAEQERAKEKKQAEKALLGEQDSEGEDDDMDAKIEKMMKSSGTRRKQEAEEPKKQQQQPEAATAPMLPGPVAADGAASKAHALLSNFMAGNVAATAAPPPPPPAPVTPTEPRPDSAASAAVKMFKNEKLTAAERAAAIASKINVKFNRAAPLVQKQAVAEAVHFEEEIEINDFPQNARWKVTHKDSVADIQEHYECAVTVRGQYVAPGKKAPEGVRPLYIVLEADSERKIQMAKAEVKRILKEEMAKAANWGPGAFGQSKGRYAITFG